MKELSEELNVNLSIPPMKYCTDNATMIACAAYPQYLKNDSYNEILKHPNNILGIEYIKAIKKQVLTIDIPSDFKVVYTPIHGTGNKLVRRILSEIGVKNVFTVPEQEAPDGDFPTVASPNPENKECFSYAIELAKKNEENDSKEVVELGNDLKLPPDYFHGRLAGAGSCTDKR